MGVYISMDILPSKIDKEEWEKVYEESLELIRAYPFMDSAFDNETYGVPWKYARRTEEEELEIGYKEFSLGWHVFGDYKTMLGAESFSLDRNIERYRKQNNVSEGCDDILADQINMEVFYGQEELHIPVASVNVFGNKTQGYPHHIYLLAIACLVESRFPKHAVIGGDISIGQMKKAIDWANTILKKPIHLTERADNGKLLKRIRNIVQDDNVALHTFMKLTMHGKDFALGKFLREQFSQEVITEYYKSKFREHDVNMMGFHDSLSAYFNLGFSIEDACEICVLDQNGCRYDAKDFAEAVLSMEWKDKESSESNELPLAYNKPESEEPETVHSQFGKIMLKMAGLQEGMQSNLTYKEVGSILQNKLGHLVEIEDLVKLEKDKYDEDEESFDELFSKLLDEEYEERPEAPEYKISDLDYLILWEKGDSLHPSIENGIKQLKDFVANFTKEKTDLFDEFHGYTDHGKIQRLIEANRFFLIRKETWDYYIENITERNMIDAIFSIFHVKADEINIHRVCKAVVNNVDLLKKFILDQ